VVPVLFEPGSFRDRSNRVFYQEGRVYRALDPQSLDHWTQLQSKSFYQAYAQEGKIVSTKAASLTLLPESERGSWAGVLEHGRIPFISYPYEWSFGMLKDAALLHLELLSAALREDVILKDASSFNIQWRGSRPVFIDLPSFIPWNPGDPWDGYRQFCELFLFPLLLQAYRDIPFQPWLRGSLEGISVEDCSRLLSHDFFRPGVFKDVLLHARLQKRYASTSRRLKDDLQKAGFHKELIQANVERLMKIVRGLSWKTLPSHWSDYEESKDYSPEDNQAKQAFVAQLLQEKRRRLVWDLGCNTGAFSRLAAAHAEDVVAVDADAKVIEELYQSLKGQKSPNVLPLVMNLTNLSSGLGWLGAERKAFTGRGKPDLILCLALVHHVTIGANIPLEEWIHWLSGLGMELLIEFVSPKDRMVEHLLRNRDAKHVAYDQALFEALLGRHFKIRRRQALKSGLRILYACDIKS
jgi:SAM-dependent methyltransferase